MSARSKKVKSAMGRALYNSCFDRHKQSTGSRVAKHTSLIEKQEAPRVITILEQTQLDEFIQSTELARASYEAERYEVISTNMMAPAYNKNRYQLPSSELQRRASAILRRPLWTTSMSAEEVHALEDKAFLDWRRNLAHLEENESVILSPFEKNVDFWRQLWRTVERSDIIVQIVDGRDPLFFLSVDLFGYVQEVARQQGRKKQCVLLINKSDFVAPALRDDWRHYFELNHPDWTVINFSALLEAKNKLDEEDSVIVESSTGPALGSHTTGSDIVNATELVTLLEDIGTKELSLSSGITVGMVGFPNVGKSSVINSLLGTKKVSASATPGKTKHIQTLALNEYITLCDCPGIVLPSVVASKAHLVVNGTMPLDHLKGGAIDAVDLVVEMVGLSNLLAHYKCSHTVLPQFLKLNSEGRTLLSALAVAKKYFLSLNVPDEQKAARLVLKDFCQGNVVHVMAPPGSTVGADLDLIEEVEEDHCEGAVGQTHTVNETIPEDDPFEDITEFLSLTRGDEDDITTLPLYMSKDDWKPPTKRALRMGSKRDLRTSNRFNASAATLQAASEMAKRINSLRPGCRGRTSKALADPYGCHAPNEL